MLQRNLETLFELIIEEINISQLNGELLLVIIHLFELSMHLFLQNIYLNYI